MKKYFLKYVSITTSLLMIGLLSCEDKEWGEDYDIKWPVSEILSISTNSAQIEDVITITGTNLDKVQSISVGTANCEILEEGHTPNQLSFKLPRRVESGMVTSRNVYKRSYTYESILTISYPSILVTGWPTEIVAGQTFTIDGENVDLITRVFIEDHEIVVRPGTNQESITISTAGVPLTIGETATIRIVGLGEIEGASEVSGVMILEPTDIFNAVAPIILWDFEDGNPIIEDAGNAPDVAERNYGGLTAPRGDNYFSVLANQTGGWTNFIYITREGPIDLSDFHDPHITFLVNTNGKRGYVNPFMTQGGDQRDNHLHNGTANERMPYGDNYLIETDGWEWRSYPVSKLFPDFNATGVFDEVRMRFTSGNVGNSGDPEDFEIHIDQIMITDGLQLPVVKVFDFEDGAPAWDANTLAEGGVIKTDAPTGGGSSYYHLSFVSEGSWDWKGAIEYSQSIDLSGTIDPHVSLLVNTNGNRAFMQFETHQNDVKWGGGPPGIYEFTTDGWEVMTFRLTDFLGNWGGSGTASEFDPKGVMDYFKIGFSTGNVDGGTYEINIDDVYISDGAMW
ncbi:IPT/TIG domain-containing protein [Natronoflexus pectinivorans]|uniref:IPT/TIG domain-containing protein n=1 Tax=Natronoflexus pectinivorans TaxID=682526 RepID=A0A4R2GIM9_9BACT|nr:IPT/TIG domain-containing protein [Natronoflexus pectinivorans]TCO08437.1 IPT/TIG domain-containing protein [Natronoflexus pectinivorans]